MLKDKNTRYINIEMACKHGVKPAAVHAIITEMTNHKSILYKPSVTVEALGRTWLRVTYKQLAEYVPGMNERQVRTALGKLVDAGELMVTELNEHSMDRTKSYSIA